MKSNLFRSLKLSRSSKKLSKKSSKEPDIKKKFNKALLVLEKTEVYIDELKLCISNIKIALEELDNLNNLDKLVNVQTMFVPIILFQINNIMNYMDDWNLGPASIKNAKLNIEEGSKLLLKHIKKLNSS